MKRDDTILDDPIPVLGFRQIRNRWETKRIAYNLFLIGGIVIMYLFEKFFQPRSAEYWVAYWKDVAICLVLANLGYSLVYALELASRRFRRKFLSPGEVNLVFAIGVVISLFLVAILGIMSALTS